LLALWAFAGTFRKTEAPDASRLWIRFLAYSAAGHFIIYSIIAYKTPWLAFLPWAHVCLLAGFAIKDFQKYAITPKVVLTGLVVVCIISQFRQSRFATGRLASDGRNPFAYVPTRGDVETLESWLSELRAVMPSGTLEPAAVIGRDYWPLPWYLRAFEKVGYWSDPPSDLATYPLVLAMPEAADAVSQTLENTHAFLPRGLRDEVPVYLYVRNDIWEDWMKIEKR